ncbi:MULTISPECIES: hypothetical protein [unclassified Microbacterium]|uniref:hypothetical protein n=1 Tax=unclassified Microbacterium TaxID=2609290 RepID=UPI000EAA1C96|nr:MULTISPECIES: hypothetical protein [unclassified Microbacterium]MBT2484972.1 hypothetical protein [Microbacterium sp. ISL-108]RKN67828.1 hypothetical protein D7252_09665 [Microbacterium sp. CGR2]
MTTGHAPETVHGAVPGATIFTGRALEHLAVGIAHEIAGVPARDVAVTLSDERGSLRVSVTVPVAVAENGGATIVESGDELRHGLIDGMRNLVGRTVSTVDIRYAGVLRTREKRVG